MKVFLETMKKKIAIHAYNRLLLIKLNLIIFIFLMINIQRSFLQVKQFSPKNSAVKQRVSINFSSLIKMPLEMAIILPWRGK